METLGHSHIHSGTNSVCAFVTGMWLVRVHCVGLFVCVIRMWMHNKLACLLVLHWQHVNEFQFFKNHMTRCQDNTALYGHDATDRWLNELCFLYPAWDEQSNASILCIVDMATAPYPGTHFLRPPVDAGETGRERYELKWWDQIKAHAGYHLKHPSYARRFSPSR